MTKKIKHKQKKKGKRQSMFGKSLFEQLGEFSDMTKKGKKGKKKW